MLSHEQAQELHALVGQPIDAHEQDGYTGRHEPNAILVPLTVLERARELAAIIVSDTEPQGVDFAPCVTGQVNIGGEVTEFMLPLLNDSVTYSQWGAPTFVLGPRVDLLEKMADGAREWAEENLCRTCKARLLDDGEGYDGECGDCADRNPANREDDDEEEADNGPEA